VVQAYTVQMLSARILPVTYRAGGVLVPLIGLAADREHSRRIGGSNRVAYRQSSPGAESFPARDVYLRSVPAALS
jgi:hypothetical protein